MFNEFKQWLKKSGVKHPKGEPSGLLSLRWGEEFRGKEIIDSLNPLDHVIENREYFMSRIYRESFWVGIDDTLEVFLGDHYDRYYKGKGRKGILDILIFPVIARRLMFFYDNPEKNLILRGIAFIPAALLTFLRYLIAVVLTIPLLPVIAIVHSFAYVYCKMKKFDEKIKRLKIKRALSQYQCFLISDEKEIPEELDEDKGTTKTDIWLKKDVNTNRITAFWRKVGCPLRSSTLELTPKDITIIEGDLKREEGYSPEERELFRLLNEFDNELLNEGLINQIVLMFGCSAGEEQVPFEQVRPPVGMPPGTQLCIGALDETGVAIKTMDQRAPNADNNVAGEVKNHLSRRVHRLGFFIETSAFHSSNTFIEMNQENCEGIDALLRMNFNRIVSELKAQNALGAVEKCVKKPPEKWAREAREAFVSGAKAKNDCAVRMYLDAGKAKHRLFDKHTLFAIFAFADIAPQTQKKQAWDILNNTGNASPTVMDRILPSG